MNPLMLAVSATNVSFFMCGLVQIEARGPRMSPVSYRQHDENLAQFSDEEYFCTHGPITAIAVSEGYAAGQNNVLG